MVVSIGIVFATTQADRANTDIFKRKKLTVLPIKKDHFFKGGRELDSLHRNPVAFGKTLSQQHPDQVGI